jgi:hypothetical protein
MSLKPLSSHYCHVGIGDCKMYTGDVISGDMISILSSTEIRQLVQNMLATYTHGHNIVRLPFILKQRK